MVDLTKHMKKGLVEQKPGQILAFASYANKIPDIVKFTIGEPDFNTPDHIKKAAEASIENNHSHYAPSNGTPGLRKAAADFLAKNMVKSMILVKSWSLMGLRNLFMTF